MKKITPNLWFDTQAEEAAQFYVSIFKNSSIGTIARYNKSGSEVSQMPEGSVLTVEFELDGTRFVGINGGPVFSFTEAISFAIECETQEEIDYYWNHLSAHPQSEQCGWVKDKFGLSWQIVPTLLSTLLKDPDPVKVERVTKAMMQMKKLDIAALQAAYDQA